MTPVTVGAVVGGGVTGVGAVGAVGVSSPHAAASAATRTAAASERVIVIRISPIQLFGYISIALAWYHRNAQEKRADWAAVKVARRKAADPTTQEGDYDLAVVERYQCKRCRQSVVDELLPQERPTAEPSVSL